MIVCGREIDAPALDWLQAQAPNLSLRKLGAALCQRLNWKGPGGRPQLSAAMGVLRRLHQLKVITLAKVQAPFKPIGQSLKAPAPPAPPLVRWSPRSLEEASPVELVLVGSRWSAAYRLWRQMLDEHHYLTSGPLAGHQLRYLIKGPGGWLGALSFSAAALHVEARDRWIQWKPQVRRENLPYLINNSRFVLLPWVQVENLASHCLSQVTQRVAADWQERFGYRPVLAETFVDLQRYRGTCYRGANWKFIGLSQGRGRQDRDRTARLSKKLLLVYPLEEQFRQKLCAEPTQRRFTAQPKPALAPPPEPTDWAQEEFAGSALGDSRLDRRLHRIARTFMAHPTLSIPQACGNKAQTKAVYRFFDNQRVNLHNLLQGHYQASARRAQQEKLILAVQDTTDLNYSLHPKTQLLGPICDKKGVIGLLMHGTMAYTAQGTALGLIDVQSWTRDPDLPRQESQRYQLPIEQKESYKWLASWKAAVRLQEQCPESTVISVGDREADIYELLLEAKKEPKAKLLIRADKQRRMHTEQEEELTNLWQGMAQRPVEGLLPLELPRTAKRQARLTQLEVRFAQVSLHPPKRKPQLGPVTVSVVTATEVGAPPGEDPVQWKLLSTLEIKTLAQALELIGYYTQRFQIEVFHRTLKSGCKIQDRQLGNAERIEACLAIDLVVAWRIVHLTKLGREVPEVPCTVYFEEAQWKALVAFATRDARPPEKPPSLRQAVRLMAMTLGGFLGRKGDGEPGTQTIWKALQRLDDIAQMWVVMTQGMIWPTPTQRELDSS